MLNEIKQTMKVTYKNFKGEFVTEEFTKEKADKAKDNFISKEYEEGNLFFAMLDLSGEKGITNRIKTQKRQI